MSQYPSNARRPLLLLIPVALAFLSACASPVTPNRDPRGETFPQVRGQALDGAAWELPNDLIGNPSILLIGYVQETQFDLDRYLIGMTMMKTPLPFYELPAIKGMIPRYYKDKIDQGMRDGIPEEDWTGVITVYRDASKLVDLLGNEKPNNARVLLLNERGTIVWHHDRGFSASIMEELDMAARTLKKQPWLTRLD